LNFTIHGEGVTTQEEGDEILALVDDSARGRLEKILGRPEKSLKRALNEISKKAGL
jgi:hypothetical protein